MRKELSRLFDPMTRALEAVKHFRHELIVRKLGREAGIKNLPPVCSFGQDSFNRLSSAYFPRHKIQQEKNPAQNEPLPSSR